MKTPHNSLDPHHTCSQRLILVVTAAGSGKRLGYDQPKAFVPIAGKPMLEHVLRRCAQYRHRVFGRYSAIAVSIPQGYDKEFSDIVKRIDGLDTIDLTTRDDRSRCGDNQDADSYCDGGRTTIPVKAVHGGLSRQQSVAFALDALKTVTGEITDDDIVLIHDAARCVMPDEVTIQVIDAVHDRRNVGEHNIAVVPAVSAVDTLYMADEDETGLRMVSRVLPRESIFRVQTPQGFIGTNIIAAHHDLADKAPDEAQAFGDDAQLIMAREGRCFVVQGCDAAIKITVSSDIPIAEQYLCDE